MLTGELEFGDLKIHQTSNYIIFVIFVFLITIVLFNLLNALAVSDTQVNQLLRDSSEKTSGKFLEFFCWCLFDVASN